MTEWIKCSERLPELGKDVLVFGDAFYRVSSLYEFGSKKHPSQTWEVDYCMTPTHWMPLPEAPHD